MNNVALMHYGMIKHYKEVLSYCCDNCDKMLIVCRVENNTYKANKAKELLEQCKEALIEQEVNVHTYPGLTCPDSETSENFILNYYSPCEKIKDIILNMPNVFDNGKTIIEDIFFYHSGDTFFMPLVH